jgi:hypothetical protein
MAKRALRRHHLARMKAKAARIGKWYDIPNGWLHLHDHLAVCARFCCANPRRFGDLTMQERRYREIDNDF